MKLIINHYARIRNGKLIFSIPSLYSDQLLELEGCDVVVNIKKRHQKPSLSQYGFYRGGILVACYESEEFSSLDNKDLIHDTYFALKFLSYVVKGKDGKEVRLTRSLADITNEEMTLFITQVLADCAEMNIEVPSPEMYYNKFYQK